MRQEARNCFFFLPWVEWHLLTCLAGTNTHWPYVVAVVHVGEATLRKRVTEFENTPAALLSVDEFDARAKARGLIPLH